jgi:hypothetical protein
MEGQMKTVAQMEALSSNEKLVMLKEAKSGTWYDGWKPYCMMCSTMQRMAEKNYGFECTKCKNMIGFDLTRLAESPLNKTGDPPVAKNLNLNKPIR